MMAEALIKKPVCSKCGEDARPQALYCFACGGKIVESSHEAEVSSIWFRGDLSEESPDAVETPETEAPDSADSDNDEDATFENKDPEESDESDAAPEELEAAPEGFGPTPEASKVKVRAKDLSSESGLKVKKSEKKLTSAADLRKRPKPFQSKRVEVIWQEKTDSPNFLFVFCGIALALLVALLFLASLYLR